MQTRRLSHWYPRRFNSRPALNDTGRRGAELRPRCCGFGYRTPHEQTNVVTETKTIEKKNKDTEDLQGGLWGGRAPQGARLLWSLEKAKHHTGDVRACVWGSWACSCTGVKGNNTWLKRNHYTPVATLKTPPSLSLESRSAALGSVPASGQRGSRWTPWEHKRGFNYPPRSIKANVAALWRNIRNGL